jgi:hypothetical protein
LLDETTIKNSLTLANGTKSFLIAVMGPSLKTTKKGQWDYGNPQKSSCLLKTCIAQDLIFSGLALLNTCFAQDSLC